MRAFTDHKVNARNLCIPLTCTANKALSFSNRVEHQCEWGSISSALVWLPTNTRRASAAPIHERIDTGGVHYKVKAACVMMDYALLLSIPGPPTPHYDAQPGRKNNSWLSRVK